ncbi:MAG: CRISPR-associated protein Csx19 [Campylobacter sp.]|nr:CRISPR-associated protein Csx19 [Campylobacter sp.]
MIKNFGSEIYEILKNGVKIPLENGDFEIKDGFGIFWLDENIKFTLVKDNKLEFYDGKIPPKNEIKSARIFNQYGEIFIYRSSESLKARVRYNDEKDEFIDKNEGFNDEELTLLGGGKNPIVPLKNGFFRLIGESGSEFIIPLEVSEQSFVKLVRRNYIRKHCETDQVYYSDFRLVDLKGVKNG